VTNGYFQKFLKYVNGIKRINSAFKIVQHVTNIMRVPCFLMDYIKRNEKLHDESKHGITYNA